MTSCGICPSCQGEVTLYQEQLEDGTVYHAGKCWNCGCYCTEYPKGYDPYKAELEAEERRKHDEAVETIREADILGGWRGWVHEHGSIDGFPYYYVTAKVRTPYHGFSRLCTLEDAIATADRHVPPGETYVIERMRIPVYVGRSKTNCNFNVDFEYVSGGYGREEWITEKMSAKCLADAKRILQRNVHRGMHWTITVRDDDRPEVNGKLVYKGNERMVEGIL